MTTRSKERMEALGYILSGGLSYSWFRVEELDEDAVTATIRTDGPDDDEGTYSQVHHIGPDDVARGLRMYAEYMAGTREAFPGEFVHRAKDMLHARFGQEQNEHKASGHTITFVSLNDADVREYELRCDCGHVWPGGGGALTEAANKALESGEFVPGVHNRADEKSYGWQTVKFGRTNGAEGDYDANTADSVMQFATLGYTIYG